MTPAQRLVQRLDELARCTDDPPRLTRLAYSPAMRRAHELVGGWMREAGLMVRVDAVGNLIGRREATVAGAKTFLLGSHLDTVRDAGRFDGALGVLLALAVAEQCGPLPFAIEVVGFIDEEGVRFQTTYLGSRALAGTLCAEDLALRGADGITLAEAIRAFGGNSDAIAGERRAPAGLLGYVEAHIEQGPVLEAADQPLGVVSAIAGQARARAVFTGEAGHAGTVPMDLRRDALCAAAEFTLAAECLAKATPGLVATVGQLAVAPGASNVIPGEVTLSLDVRHQDDAVRTRATSQLGEAASRIAVDRGSRAEWSIVQETAAQRCDAWLGERLSRAVDRCRSQGSAEALPSNAGLEGTASAVPHLPSGAGHDAAALAALCPVAMLFIRCRRGLSHHPDEFASEADIAAALHTLVHFVQHLATDHA